jgi:hypothetical protein
VLLTVRIGMSMAYRQFDKDETADWASDVSIRQRVITTRPRLTPEERQVVLLSRIDSTASLRAPGRSAKIARLLFGHEKPNRLASARLEALRRFAVLRRVQGDGIEAAEYHRLTDAGYGAAAVAEVDALLHRSASWPKPSRAHRAVVGLLLPIMAVAILIPLTHVFGTVLGNGLLGFAVAGLLVTFGVPAVALFSPQRRRLG